MGRIVHKAIASTKSGAGAGELEVDADWIMPDGSIGTPRAHALRVPRRRRTRAASSASPSSRAGDKVVAFPDNKEGVLGMRVARALEHPADKPEVFTDASGKPTAVPVLDNTGVTGSYTSSEGLTGDKVWGTRGRWCALSGKVESEDVVLLMLDHPKNPGYPTYWHARGYGLFAANPLGQAALSNGKETLNFALQPDASDDVPPPARDPAGPVLQGARRARGEGLRRVGRRHGAPGRLRRLRQHHRDARARGARGRRRHRRVPRPRHGEGRGDAGPLRREGVHELRGLPRPPADGPGRDRHAFGAPRRAGHRGGASARCTCSSKSRST